MQGGRWARAENGLCTTFKMFFEGSQGVAFEKTHELKLCFFFPFDGMRKLSLETVIGRRKSRS